MAGRILLTLLSAQLALVFVSVLRLGATAQESSLIDCYEFVDQAEAQRYFEAKGAPSRDPYYLDGDDDGIACEPGPTPTPVNDEVGECCDGYDDYLSEGGNPSQKTRDEMRDYCAAYDEQESGP